MCLAGTSLCQRCQMPDKIPSAPSSSSNASVLRQTAQIYSNHKNISFFTIAEGFLNRFRYKNTLPRNNCFGIECFTLKMVEIYFIKKNQNVRIPYDITVCFKSFDFLLLLNRIVVFFHDFLRWFCIYFIIFSL